MRPSMTGGFKMMHTTAHIGGEQCLLLAIAPYDVVHGERLSTGSNKADQAVHPFGQKYGQS